MALEKIDLTIYIYIYACMLILNNQTYFYNLNGHQFPFDLHPMRSPACSWCCISAQGPGHIALHPVISHPVISQETQSNVIWDI